MRADVLSIDPGLTATGWAVLNVPETRVAPYTVDASGTVCPKPKQPLDQRLAYLATRFMLMQRAWDPTIIVVEDPTDFTRHPRAPYRSLRSQMLLGAAFGVVLAACRGSWPTIPIVLYKTKQWLRFGGRFQKKEAVLERVRTLVTFGSGNHNVSEHELAACGLALHHMAKEKLL